MLFNLLITICIFVLVVTLVGAIYLGWEDSIDKWKRRNKNR